ncbi:GNAT family N-acetyltransferase [Actinospica sp. MGRD01-02]|uniref:GNAT family N-acetyltransferase n=1 Tax=Actinospica acidithermotolerans TaxID=2828514 RepID=A0A941IHB0_9ACTN|nr:GNAT family N-acetyltransferase [Actinospica acidithermotolerans]MBR7824998.1 GNAT family N-acetyltransferase [Actinospica acidithermotolerans]
MARDAWVAAGSIDEFLRTTVPFLAAEPVLNTLLLTVFDRLRMEGPHAFGESDPLLLTWYGADGSAAGAVVRTPPFPFVLSDVPAAAVEAFVDLVLDGGGSGFDGREINLPLTGEEPFAAAWSARTGRSPRVLERFRLYRLDRLVPPAPAPVGKPKLAGREDVALIADFIQAFWREVEHSMPEDSRAVALRMAEGRVAEGIFWLWLDESGTPVALAGHTPPTAGMCRIGPVFTPPELRGHGYAAGATTAATRASLALGADEVLLFTDLANPISNRLYQRLGYRPVSDRARLEFAG